MLQYLLLSFFLVAAVIITIITTRGIFDKLGNIKDAKEAKRKADRIFFEIYLFLIIISLIFFGFAVFELKNEDMPIAGIIGILVSSTGITFKSIDGIKKILEDAKKEEEEEKDKKKKKKDK